MWTNSLAPDSAKKMGFAWVQSSFIPAGSQPSFPEKKSDGRAIKISLGSGGRRLRVLFLQIVKPKLNRRMKSSFCYLFSTWLRR